MEVWKIIFLYKWVICRFHVNLPGCRLRMESVNINPPGFEHLFVVLFDECHSELARKHCAVKIGLGMEWKLV